MPRNSPGLTTRALWHCCNCDGRFYGMRSLPHCERTGHTLYEHRSLYLPPTRRMRSEERGVLIEVVPEAAGRQIAEANMAKLPTLALAHPAPVA